MIVCIKHTVILLAYKSLRATGSARSDSEIRHSFGGCDPCGLRRFRGGMTMTYRGYKYNGAIDVVNVQPNERYDVGDGQGLMFLHDIFDPIPDQFYSADYLFVDPPWNLGNIKTFYMKAELSYGHGIFDEFIYRIFEVIRELHDHGRLRSAFIEIGKQKVDVFEGELAGIYSFTRRYESKYYNQYLCYILQGWDAGHYTDIPDDKRDELKLMDEIIRLNPGKKVLDFCGGQGGVSRTAYKYGNPFILTELNRNRLAVAIKDIMDKGGKVTTKVV